MLDARFDNLALAARREGYDPTLFGYTDTDRPIREREGRPGDPHADAVTEGVLPGFTARQLLPEHEKTVALLADGPAAYDAVQPAIFIFQLGGSRRYFQVQGTSIRRMRRQTALS